MNILMFYNHLHSLDPVIYKYLRKQAKIFTISKNKTSDFFINKDDNVNNKKFSSFLKKNKISYFLYSENSSYIPDFLNLLPKEVIKVMFLIDTHISIKRRLPYFSLFDLILLVNFEQKEKLLKYNPNIEGLLYGGDTETFYKINKSKKIYNITFDGNIIPWVHFQRFIILLYLKINEIPIFYTSAKYNQLNSIYNQTKILLNRSPMGGWNMRLFEVLSSGTFLLTDKTNNDIPKIFIDKKYLVYYESLSDLKNKIEYYLTHEKERKKIANAGYNFVRKNYSWEMQIKKMLKIFYEFKFKEFKREPYYLSLFKLNTFSFRNKNIALRDLNLSIKNNEIDKYKYIYYRSICIIYLTTTSIIIDILNYFRINAIKFFQR